MPYLSKSDGGHQGPLKGVLVSGNFADLTEIALKSENYSFNCVYLYESESF